MNTLKKINKPIKFFGLTSGQCGLFMLANALIIIICIFRRLHPVIIVGSVGGIFFLSGLLLKTLMREHKAGNPDYLTGLRIKAATPVKIVDKHKVFNLIIQRK